MMDQDSLRILYVTPYYGPAWAYGGPVRVVVEVARRTAAYGHNVTVLTTDALDAAHRAPVGTEVMDGVTVHRVRNLSNALAWRRLFMPASYGAAASRLLPDADLVHINEFRSFLNPAALPALRRTPRPYVLSPHGGLPLDLGRTAYKRVYDLLYGNRLLTGAARLHAATEMERQQYLDIGLPDERIDVIPNGIDVDAYNIEADVSAFKQQHDIPERSPVVGFLGRLNTIKGVDFLLDAFVEVLAHQPESILVLAGPDDGAQLALEAQIDRLGIRSSVRFVGYLAGEADKAAAYRAFNVYVLPSRYEILGITLLEALLNGVPPITTDRCGLAPMLDQEEIGSVVSFGDVTSLSTRILQALRHPEMAAQQARRGQRYVAEHFNWDAVADRWMETYRKTAQHAMIQS